MDLAKIRKKSLQMANEPGEKLLFVQTPSPEPAHHVPVAPAEVFSLHTEMVSSLPIASVASVQSSLPDILPAAAACSPIEAILAGRSASGCVDDSISADDNTSEVVVKSSLEFLCFRVSDEIYGINIMDIKEIIKPREVTEVPRAPVFVSGVLSLRGTIIPIIDMRIRLGLALEEPTGKERIVVIKNSNSFSGLLVDEVIQVMQVQLDAVEAAPSVLDGIDREFISGLARSEDRLIIVLNLETIADINLY
jgi:purine-binding chemotaxis protein CheW